MAEGPVCQALGPTRAVRLLLAAHDREACVYVHETVCPLEVSVVGEGATKGCWEEFWALLRYYRP